MPINPVIPFKSLTADQYFEHWMKRKIWTHLEYSKHQRRLLWCASKCEGEVLADVGCMLGHSTAIMAKARPGTWLGIDFSLDAIHGAEKLFPAITFLYLDRPAELREIKVPPIDSVVCSEVIEHIADDRAFLEDIVATARKRVILTTPCIDAQDPGHVRIYTPAQFAQLLEGFDAEVNMDKEFFYAVIKVSR